MNNSFINPTSPLYNVLQTNTASFEATYPAYNENLLNDKNVSLVNYTDKVLKFQQQYLVEDSFTGHQLITENPISLGGSNGSQIAQFSIQTQGFVKANNIKLKFKIPVLGQTANFTTNEILSFDSINVSNLEQPHFTYLTIIKEMDCKIGYKEVSIFPNNEEKMTNRIFRAAACLKKSQTLAQMSAGLNVTKTCRARDWESSNKDIYDNNFKFPLFYAGNGSQFSYDHLVTVPLADIFPFFDSDCYLPIGFTFKFYIKFQCERFKTLTGDTTYKLSQGLSYSAVNSRAQEWPISQNSLSVLYDAFQLKENLVEQFNSLPIIITNHKYYVEKQYRANTLSHYELYDPLVIPPEYIIMFFTLEESQTFDYTPLKQKVCVFPFKDPEAFPVAGYINDNKLEMNSNGFLGGFQVRNIKVYFNEHKKYESIDTDTINDPLLLQAYQDFNVWKNSMNYDELTLNSAKDPPNDVTTKLKLVENIIPIEIPTNNSGFIRENVRENLTSATNIKIAFDIEGFYSLINNTSDMKGTTYLNQLPPNSTIHILYAYNYQLAYNRKNSQISSVSWPFVLKDNKINFTNSSLI